MTLFSKIIAGEIPSYKIAEDDSFFAFLDIYPLTRGHVLCIPKTEVDKFYDLDDNFLSRWMIFAKPIARAIEKAFPCQRTGMTIIGLEVPHAHMHLMPINNIDDMNFHKPKLKLSDTDLTEIQQKITTALNELE